jgi:hypothetical protein
MKGLFILLTIAFISVVADVNAQRYRNENNLGNEEMVRFIAMKNGDIMEFNWKINSTRKIQTIELQKGNLTENSVEWVTVKEITDEDKKYIDYLPDLGEILYKLILTDDTGKTREYEPVFQIKKGGTALLL